MSAKSQTDAPLITKRALNRALLARQMLLARERIAAITAIERLAGMQSQAPNPPYAGLWTRLLDFQPPELAILIVERKAVRLALMRSTIHLVSSADAIAWRPLVQPVMDRMYASTYGRSIAGVDRARLHASGVEHVEARPSTFEELGVRLLEQWPDRDPTALANAIRTSATLIQVPPRGLWGQSGQARHTTIEAWLGQSVASKPDPRKLAARYLAAFGPASVRDFQTWTGLTRQQTVFDTLRPELLTFADESGRELFDLPAAPRPDAGIPAPVRFLAEFDNVLLSYSDPSRVIAPDHRKRVMSINGLVAGTVLIDGFVEGTWSIKRDKLTAELVVKPFAPIDSSFLNELDGEGAALLAFAAAGLEPRISIELVA